MWRQIVILFLVEKSLRCWNILLFCTSASSLGKLQKGLVDWLKNQPCEEKQWQKSFVTLEEIKTVNSTRFTKFIKGKPEGKGGEATGAHRVQVCTLSATACNKNCWSFKVTFWSSFPSVELWLCAAYANIVLFLCSISRNSNTNLVEPLIAVAVTLDPVHLKAK